MTSAEMLEEFRSRSISGDWELTTLSYEKDRIANHLVNAKIYR